MVFISRRPGRPLSLRKVCIGMYVALGGPLPFKSYFVLGQNYAMNPHACTSGIPSIAQPVTSSHVPTLIITLTQIPSLVENIMWFPNSALFYLHGHDSVAMCIMPRVPPTILLLLHTLGHWQKSNDEVLLEKIEWRLARDGWFEPSYSHAQLTDRVSQRYNTFIYFRNELLVGVRLLSMPYPNSKAEHIPGGRCCRMQTYPPYLAELDGVGCLSRPYEWSSEPPAKIEY